MVFASGCYSAGTSQQRHAQFRLDFVEAENSTGFHAPEEAARIFADSINFSRQGQLALRDPTYKPDFTNEKAIEGVPSPGEKKAETTAAHEGSEGRLSTTVLATAAPGGAR